MPLAAATGVKPYFVGKPNPLMMRAALRRLGAHSESSVMIGDRMDTDIVAGTEAGMRTILVLSGVTRHDAVARFPYQPTMIVESVATLLISAPIPAQPSRHELSHSRVTRSCRLSALPPRPRAPRRQ